MSTPGECEGEIHYVAKRDDRGCRGLHVHFHSCIELEAPGWKSPVSNGEEMASDGVNDVSEGPWAHLRLPVTLDEKLITDVPYQLR
jgi:hypothetical protein